nr:recombinase zinc beta ribbon domain-containing protein [Lachnospiraceae bacterium]
PEQAEVFPLAGMVFCAGCGEPMVRKTVPAGGKRYVYYVCSGNKKDKHACSSHSISERALIKTVIELAKTFIGRAIAAAFAMDILNATPNKKPGALKYESRIKKLREEAESCHNRKKNLYEDFKDGILSQEEYSMLRNQYQTQIDDIEKSIAAVEAERDVMLASGTGKQEWIEKIKKYEGVSTLDRELVTFLIERVEVVDSETINVKYRFDKVLSEMERIVRFYSSEDLKEAM